MEAGDGAGDGAGAAADVAAAAPRARPACPPHAGLVAATFVSHVFTFGPLYSLGVFVPAFKEHFAVDLDLASAMVSVMFAMQFFGSLLAGLLIPALLGHRAVAACGAALVLGGYVGASFAEGVAAMFVCLGVCVGLGLGACNLAGLTALNARVKERRALAVGWATSGTTVGAMGFPPACAAMIEALGWRQALRIFGIASGVALLAVAPAFVVPQAPAAGEKRRRCRLPCADARYLCWWCNTLVAFFGYFAPLTLLADFAQEELQTGPGMAAAAYTVLGSSACVTRVCLGWITERCGGPRRVHASAQVLNGILVMLLPFCWNTQSLLVWSACYGLTVGPLIALISVILAELFGIERLPVHHGFSRLAVGLGAFGGPPLLSRLVIASGYVAGFGAAGGCLVGASLFLLLLSRLNAAAGEARRAGEPARV